MDYSKKVDELFDTQLREWELARVNYGLLDRVRNRSVDFGNFRYLVQFNPERIRSSAAKVDAKSIGDRPCFLCAGNRPPEQRGVQFDDSLTILINPFPIFPRHLTIVSDAHTDQRIRGNFELMLELVRSIPGYVVFYNGPQCGASAPDHFHFQAGNRGFLPIEDDFRRRSNVYLLTVSHGVEIWNWKGYGRGIATLRGASPQAISKVFDGFYGQMLLLQPDKPEPMMNILACKDDDAYIVHLLPRKLHRPSQFFEEGGRQIVVGPAAVDLTGIMITPREEDFEKMTKADLEDIFSQVCLDEDQIKELFKDFI